MECSSAYERTTALFKSLDGGDVAGFAARFAPGASQRIGDRPPMQGRDAIERGNRQFLATIAGLEHRIEDLWSIDDTLVVRLHVHYRLLDGASRDMRTVTIFREGDAGIEELEVFFGSTPTFTGAHA